MPTYAYRGTECDHEFEVFQKFSDAPLTTCPECGKPIRKVFQPVGVVFKGSGWYINDSRGSKASASGSSETKKTDSPTDKPEKSDNKEPAAVTPAANSSAEPAKASAS